MATHIADGLYYLTHADLVDNHACEAAIDEWALEFGETKRVPITLELALRAYHPISKYDLNWTTHAMLQKNRITIGEARRFYAIYWPGISTTEDAHAFMNMLAARAKREGRLP